MLDLVNFWPRSPSRTLACLILNRNRGKPFGIHVPHSTRFGIDTSSCSLSVSERRQSDMFIWSIRAFPFADRLTPPVCHLVCLQR